MTLCASNKFNILTSCLLAFGSRAFNVGGFEEKTLIRPTRHVAEVFPEIVIACGTPVQKRLRHVKVALQILKLRWATTKPEVSFEVTAKMRTGFVEELLIC